MGIEPKLSKATEVTCCGKSHLWDVVAYFEPAAMRPSVFAWFFCALCITFHLHADGVKEFSRWMSKPSEERVNVWDRMEDLIES